METSESAEGGWPAAEQMKVPVSETWRVVPPHPGHLHPGHHHHHHHHHAPPTPATCTPGMAR